MQVTYQQLIDQWVDCKPKMKGPCWLPACFLSAYVAVLGLELGLESRSGAVERCRIPNGCSYRDPLSR